MAQKFYSPRETRSLSRFLNKRGDITPDHDSSKTSHKTPKRAPKNKPVPKMAEPYKSIADKSRSDDSSDSLDEENSMAGGPMEGSSDNDDDDDDDESEAYAPSGHANKRMGHQAGLHDNHDQDDGLDSAEDWDDLSSSPIAEGETFLEQDGSDDDDGYQEVDFISGLEEDEPEVERLEEGSIIESLEKDEALYNPIIHSSSLLPHEMWPGTHCGDHLLFRNDIPVLCQNPTTFDESFNKHRSGTPDFLPAFMSSPAVPERRVRFADEISGQALFEEADSIDFGPDTDTFVLRENLSDRMARIIDKDNDWDDGGFDDPQYSDILGRRASHSTPGPPEALTPAESPVKTHFDLEVGGGYLSGYETDDGEETDDCMIPPSTINPPNALRPSHSFSSKPKVNALTRASNSSRRKISKGQRQKRGPRFGSFRVEKSKPLAYFDHHAKLRLIQAMIPPSRIYEHLADDASIISSNAPPSPHAPLIDGSGMVAPDQVKETNGVTEKTDNCIISTETDVMIPSLLETAPEIGYLFDRDILGPPEAFFSYDHPMPRGSFLDFRDRNVSDDDDGEDVLNVSDFIDFGNGSSDDEPADTKPLSPSSSQENCHSTLLSDKAVDKSYPDLLSHFDKAALVTSFRRNQDRHSAGTRYAHDDTATRALKGPRLGAFSISPKSPIKSSIQQRKEKAQTSRNRSLSYLEVSTTKKLHSSQHRRIHSS